jgi:ribosomal protein L24
MALQIVVTSDFGGGVSSAETSSLDLMGGALGEWAGDVRSAGFALRGVTAAIGSLAGPVLALAGSVEQQVTAVVRVVRDFADADRNRSLTRNVLDVALGEAGYVEGHNEANKFGAWFGMDHNYWCAMFVSWAFAQAGHPLPAVTGPNGFAKVQRGWEYAEKTGRRVWKPKAGDIFFINHGAGKGHTGIVVSVDEKAGTMVTIEGNTNAAGARNGTMVRSKSRPIRQANAGFWRVAGEIVPEDRFAPRLPRTKVRRRRRAVAKRRFRRRRHR